MNVPIGANQFFEEVSEFFAKVLPIVGVIVLVALFFLMWELIKFVKGLDVTVNKINDTIVSLDKSVEKLQAPLNTVQSLSYTVDSVHIVSKRAVNKSVSMITDNYGVVKDWVSTFFKDNKKNEENDITIREEV
ncbi:MAG: hypothetical protein GX769_04855 [Erysipelothrix sp.]|nr:hypothetical protein [Erysipelothrix sp.]